MKKRYPGKYFVLFLSLHCIIFLKTYKSVYFILTCIIRSMKVYE